MASTSATLAPSESAIHLGDPGRATTSNAPSPTAVSDNPSPAADAQEQSAPQSQPMTVTSSTASDSLNLNGNDAITAVPYGTRSRNRPGTSRPNYADDKEIDHEIEATGRYHQPKAPKRSSAASVAVSTDQSMEQTSMKNGFASVNGSTAAVSSDQTGPLLNGSITTPNTASSSKKRKQPGSNTTLPTQTVPTTKPTPIPSSRARFIETNLLSFTNSRARLNDKEQLVADDGTEIQVNDHMYFICEPPGEPYYFGRIMEFLHVSNSTSPVEAVRVNWFYRPKDIQRRVQDARVVFASMHSDICPLTSMRGKCDIQHIANIIDLEEYRKQKDSFWFDKLYDRYMHRYYEVIPTSKVVNVPPHVKKVLDERWKFVLVEVGRGRDLTAASKVCRRCADFAANHNSVDCAVCKNTYHMQCVRPPLLRKPARGFAWACAACSRAQELKMEARNTPLSETEISRLAEAESFDDEDIDSPPQDLTTRENSTGPDDHLPPTAAQLSQGNLWQWRYLGIHSKPEDALDYDDRIYPRASSRLGPRHQANISIWHGRPIEFIKPAEAKKKYKPSISTKKDGKAAALAAENDKREKRPKWVFDEPPGFVTRGQDEPVELKGRKEYTAQLTFMMPDASKFTERGLDENETPLDYANIVDNFMQRCDEEIAPLYNIGRGSVDVRTKGLEKLQESDYNVEMALEAMRHLSAKTDLKQPELTKEEIRRFEEGVAKYGSELHLVARHVSSTIKESRIVRFYYLWKKTPRGREIWGNYEGRKSKKDSKRVDKDGNIPKLLDDVANDADDSAFDNDKAARVKRSFTCKFCSTRSSRLWRRAPATAPGTIVPRDPASKNAKDKSNWLVLALCGKCAYLWRRYAVQYESVEDIGKKIAISGGRASKRKVDEELMRTVLEAQMYSGDIISKASAQIAIAAGIEVPPNMIEPEEPPKKKVKSEKDTATPEAVIENKKKPVPEKPVEIEPLKPEMPRVKEHPCAVCHIINHPDHKMLKCRDCRLHVHAPCYGVSTYSGSGPWYCDMCKNDSNTQVSTNYECVLCPVRRTPQELMEPPKVSHKKKTDRERDKERAEREMVQEAGRRWREDQLQAGRPVDPREPLKRTAWNNWMHVNCAVWTKEIRFGDAEHLDDAEGVGFIPGERFEIPCKFCKETGYPIVSCQYPACSANFHVGCAHQHGCILGFDISPVKMSRRDSVVVMKLDSEVGLAAPGIWCSHHSVPTIVHDMLEMTPSGLTALQEFAQTYKQVDTSMTGTVRRAAQFNHTVSLNANAGQHTHRRTSTINSGMFQPVELEQVTGQSLQTSPSPSSPQVNGNNIENKVYLQDSSTKPKNTERRCCTCLITTSPKWWPVTTDSPPNLENPEFQTNTTRHASETTSLHGGNSIQPPSPEMYQHQNSTLQPPNLPSGLSIKAEFADINAHDVPEEIRYQCHKCHVQKKTPPSSPSALRRRKPLQIDSMPDIATQQQPYSAGPPPNVPLGHSIDGPGHSHPLVNGAGSQPHLWQNGSSWPAPPLRNPAPAAHHGPPPPVYGGPSPYQHARPSEFGGYPYPNPPMHYTGPGSLPARPPPNGIPQHSPPPVAFAHPLIGQPLSTAPPGQPTSPRMSVTGQWPYSSDSLYRPPDSANAAYTGARAYHPLPSISGHPPSLDQVDKVRRPSISADAGTPRAGIVRPHESPRVRYEGNGREETPILIDGPMSRDRRSSNAGPGASASPSLRNLLS